MPETMRALRWLPPLGWTALIAWFSTDQWSGVETQARIVPFLSAVLPWATPETLDALHWMIRKAAHVTEYGVLAALWGVALGGWRRALALSALTALLDELHQGTTLSREGSVADFVLDSASAGTFLLLRTRPRAVFAFLTAMLLWIGAAGGIVLLAINWLAAVPSGWLWLSTGAAWLALGLWTRAKRRER